MDTHWHKEEIQNRCKRMLTSPAFRGIHVNKDLMLSLWGLGRERVEITQSHQPGLLGT